jgi:hypothetical protein
VFRLTVVAVRLLEFRFGLFERLARGSQSGEQVVGFVLLAVGRDETRRRTIA